MQRHKLNSHLYNFFSEYKYILIIAFTAWLSGCAGKHTLRPDNYYSINSENHVIKVAFDQEGSIYPIDSNHDAFDWEPSWKCRFADCGWQLHRIKNADNKELVYDYFTDHKAALSIITKDLNESIQSTGHLVVLIHGFNNDHDQASANFGEIQKKIEKDVTFLEVYWDGLGGWQPISFWGDALTYSNLAGQLGLRRILNSVENKPHLTFVTHSRGAAVALSAISDPKYDEDICAPQENNVNKTNIELCAKQLGENVPLDPDKPLPRFSPFKSGNFSSLNTAMFAPAIGSGHIWEGTSRYLGELDKVNLIVGANTKDFATSKVVAGHEFYGDTSLGGNKCYIESATANLYRKESNIRLQTLWFHKGRYHGLLDYFDQKTNKQKPECMLWAASLITTKPHECNLKQVKLINTRMPQAK
ncbi:alpha/beta hydrolase [Marinagarivorans cellulosilyticus]|uniref:Alpha/beta hydrolase n=1 Tax=Marinagarivorans cellulosilyticus TaxID=2721545 RepID=A0AAN2BL92_9GAMM|nr:alpha/beta hydrolase [Marinagarivorans cellulosilyticus]BCD98854.1 hypothetical protein MARGE09_P3055 [Marinagarivorans cellulosilyticus]